MKVKEENRKKLSTVKTRPAIMLVHTKTGDDWVLNGENESGPGIREFENRGEAKKYFTNRYINNTDVKATVYVKDETLEFIHKEPVVKAVKA